VHLICNYTSIHKSYRYRLQTPSKSPIHYHTNLSIPEARGTTDTPGLLVALLPLHVHDLLELQIRRVGRQQACGLGVRAGQADLAVDVEQVALAAAGRHDGRRAVGLVVLEVVARHGAVESVLCARLTNISNDLLDIN
jgi:hypothetical protein